MEVTQDPQILAHAGCRSRQSRLEIVPCSIKEAGAFVKQHHRHHRPPQGARFAVAVADEAGVVRGVAMVGTPVARMAADGWTAEVVRVATDGCSNACSALYGACWRAARALGYKRLITYTLPEEGGTSLRAAGWKCLGEAFDQHPTRVKMKWERTK